MSDRREWAQRTLARLAAEIGAWPQRKSDKVFQKALIDLAADWGLKNLPPSSAARSNSCRTL
jgi:hypothetical protein